MVAIQDMKIIVIVRSRNEEANIERFCLSYQWADQIFVADGGSTDDTVALAKAIPKVKVKSFDKRTNLQNNLWRNPAGEHLNFLTEWAENGGADWILMDDCDCFPNLSLQKNAREVMETTKAKVIYAVRIYLWGQREYFPQMSKPTGDWCPSLWGWRASLKLRFTTHKTNLTHNFKIADNVKRYNIFPPLCLLHNAWPDEETTKRKMEFYDKSGQHPGMVTPLDFAGELRVLPEWARE